MLVVANSSLYIKAYQIEVVEGQHFNCPDQIAQELLQQGKVRKPDPPKVVYQTKVIVPKNKVVVADTSSVVGLNSPHDPDTEVRSDVPSAPEVSPRLTFRDRALLNAKSKKLATESDRVLPEPDIPE